MNSTRSFLNRALAPLSAATMATFALALACSSDPAPAGGGEGGASAGKGGASSAGAAGKPAKAGNAGIEDAGGSAGEADGSAGEAGEAGGAGHGGGALNAGGMNPGTGGSGGSGTAGGAQGGSGGAPAAVCGNNQLEAGEECDDGNTKDWDGCSSKCKSKCEACEKKYCAPPPASQEDVFLNCFTDTGSVSKPTSGKNLAQQGPRSGSAEAEAMRQPGGVLTAYELQSRRSRFDQHRGAFVDPLRIADCKNPQKGPHGPCADEVGAAAESMDLAIVAQRENRDPICRGNGSSDRVDVRQRRLPRGMLARQAPLHL